MRFPTTTRYGLRAAIHIAQSDHICSVKEIGLAEGIPAKYLEKIILKLSKAELISAKRGATGGYFLKRAAGRITVGDIVRALETNNSPAPCLEHGYRCPRQKKCQARGIWQKIDESLNATLDGITLGELIG